MRYSEVELIFSGAVITSITVLKKDFDLPCAVKGYAWEFLWAVLKIAQYEVR